MDSDRAMSPAVHLSKLKCLCKREENADRFKSIHLRVYIYIYVYKKSITSVFLPVKLLD